MIYSEEDIIVSGALWEDEAQSIPIPFDNKQLVVYVIKNNVDKIELTIPDNRITKVDNTYAFTLTKEETRILKGNYGLQFNLIENGSVVKSIINGLYIKGSKDVFNS